MPFKPKTQCSDSLDSIPPILSQPKCPGTLLVFQLVSFAVRIKKEEKCSGSRGCQSPQVQSWAWDQPGVPALRLSRLGTDKPQETGEDRGEGQEGHPDPSLTTLARLGAAFAGDRTAQPHCLGSATRPRRTEPTPRRRGLEVAA